MFSFSWNSVDDSTFQGPLNKYTNAFKGFQTRYFVLDNQTKSLLYFMPEEVRKKGPRGVIELTDCWISPSNEDDVTFTLQAASGESFKFRAFDAKERQKWIDRLRGCSGTNAADLFVSSLPSSKSILTNSSTTVETNPQISNRRSSKIFHHQQTLKEMKEVLHCLELNQRDFVETIDAIPDTLPINALSKDMLLLRSISQSCIHSLQDSLVILTRRKTPDTELLPIPSAPSIPSMQSTTTTTTTKLNNLSGKQLSQSLNIGTSGKSNSAVALSSQSNSASTLNKTISLSGLNQSSSLNDSVLSVKSFQMDVDQTIESSQ